MNISCLNFDFVFLNHRNCERRGLRTDLWRREWLYTMTDTSEKSLRSVPFSLYKVLHHISHTITVGRDPEESRPGLPCLGTENVTDGLSSFLNFRLTEYQIGPLKSYYMYPVFFFFGPRSFRIKRGNHLRVNWEL